ncbi:MAG: hypothetical protein A3D33_11140 [Candidatus Rokubacteria bacterium RIFCSPHIGHO2_02_FULL_73_26]|nr:MAG: hypothetical protein A3D33_11140 [Candidatus Rokubacteria bacterium RIFCSPHIGHO2_02_FULL_73_26]
MTPRTRTGFSARSISAETPAPAASRPRLVAAGTTTRSTSGSSASPTSNPYRAGSRASSVAAWIAGTKSSVSRRSRPVRASAQKSVEPVRRTARATTVSPALYAACARSQEPNCAWRSRRYAAAATVARSGSRRSSTQRSTRSP